MIKTLKRINFKRLLTKDIHLYMEGESYNPETDVRTNIKEILVVLLLLPLIIFIMWLLLSMSIIVFS